MRTALQAALAALLLLPLSACHTTRDFPTPGAHWKNAQGQLQYTTPKRSVIGETVLSGNGLQDFQLDYLAGPGVPLMRLQESGNSARMEGVFAGGSWQGDPVHIRGRLASWAALREVFAAVHEQGAAPSATLHSAPGAQAPWTAQLSQTAATQRVRVEFPRTKERFTFVLAK
ncbi:MAG: hypothetical protein ACFUZC_22610 [Chthoniobacteraceae bacterium]